MPGTLSLRRSIFSQPLSHHYSVIEATIQPEKSRLGYVDPTSHRWSLRRKRSLVMVDLAGRNLARRHARRAGRFATTGASTWSRIGKLHYTYYPRGEVYYARGVTHLILVDGGN